MNIYRIFQKADNKLVYEYKDAAGPTEFNQFPFAEYDYVLHGTDDPPAPDPAPPVYNGRRELTRLEFMRLFTSAERIAIRDFVAGTTPPAKAGRDFMAMMELSNEVSLDDADTVAGVNFMEARGLIGAGRAAEILYG